MDWAKGFTAKYTYTVVDPESWRDLETHRLFGGSITKTMSGLMESADLDITELPTTGEVWVRIYLNATQGASGERVALFTGLMQTPEASWHGRLDTYAAELYSVLKPADDVLLQRGWYAPAGYNGAELAAELLGIGAAPVSYEADAPTLQSPIVAEDSETNLSMAQKVVDTIGWRIRIAGDGRISVEPKATDKVLDLDPVENDVVELNVTDTRDWFSCPNVLRAVYRNMVAIARDEDPDSPYSIQNRGREIWLEDKNPALNDREGLEEYAARKLREEQIPTRKIRYTRRFMPDVYPGDIVGMHYPALNIDGDFRIASQKITLGYGASVSEEGEAHG